MYVNTDDIVAYLPWARTLKEAFVEWKKSGWPALLPRHSL